MLHKLELQLKNRNVPLAPPSQSWLSIDVSGGTGAQLVAQPDGLITVSEGARLELRCNYSSSVSPYLFWYVQYPNQGLQLLLKYTSGNSLVSGIKGFKAEFRRSETSFHLEKQSALWSDSAKYFCALGDTVPGMGGGAEHKLLVNVRLSVTQEINLGHFQ
ncbi:T-cell receptor alpha chain V region PY14, partial [Eschrichtius robustus]|nr:T-cell receptor alpha chain V region PY14 [Eschrichtius robustus]